MMESNFIYYVALLLVVIIGFVVLKKVASCMLKTVLTLVLIAVGAVLYWLFLR